MNLTTRRLLATGALIAAGTTGFVTTLIPPVAGAAIASIPPASPDSFHAQVLAQGVVEVGTGEHLWVLGFHGGVTTPIEIPAAGPTFVLPSLAAVRVLAAGGGLGSHVEAGEAGFIAAGQGYQLSATTPADVLDVGLSGGTGPGQFTLTEGQYDFELVRDVLAPGERLPVTGSIASLALVTGGAVTLPDESVLSAGFNLDFTTDFALTNQADGPAVVVIATLSRFDAPASAGAPLPSAPPTGESGSATPGSLAPNGTSAGNPTPGYSTPSDATPVDSTPDGSTPSDGSTPGNTTPGNSTPGNSTPGNSTPGSSPTTVPTTGTQPAGTEPGTTSPVATTPPTPPPTTVPPTAPPTAPPTTQGEAPLALQLVSCSGGQTLNIRVDASAGNGFRRNIQSVSVSRQNNEGAYTSPWSLQWIGEDTAEHDEWSTQNQVTGQNQNMGDGLRITARSVGGQTQTINTTLSASC